jgi:hypothetical protein
MVPSDGKQYWDWHHEGWERSGMKVAVAAGSADWERPAP